MKIQISLQQFDGTIFVGVIALFVVNYFIKVFLCATPTF